MQKNQSPQRKANAGRHKGPPPGPGGSGPKAGPPAAGAPKDLRAPDLAVPATAVAVSAEAGRDGTSDEPLARVRDDAPAAAVADPLETATTLAMTAAPAAGDASGAAASPMDTPLPSRAPATPVAGDAEDRFANDRHRTSTPVAPAGPATALRPGRDCRSRGTVTTTTTDRPRRASRIAGALGWVGIVGGMTRLLAPQAVARGLGISQPALAMRAIGAAGIASGAGMLRARHAAPWMWGRVASDLVELGTLALSARRAPSTRRTRTGAAVAVVAGIALLDALASMRQQRHESTLRNATLTVIDAERSILVDCTPGDCYRFWRDFANLPRFMRHLESITVVEGNLGRITHWTVAGPDGERFEWDTELTVDEPERLLAWCAISGEIDSAATVSFEPGPDGRGAVVGFEMRLAARSVTSPPLPAVLFGGDLGRMLDEALLQFKEVSMDSVDGSRVRLTSPG